MSSTKKLHKTKPAPKPAGSHSRYSVFAKARALTKIPIMATMFSLNIFVPDMLAMSISDLLESVAFYIEHDATQITWDKVYSCLIKADNAQREAVNRCKQLLHDVSKSQCDRLLQVVLPLRAKWELTIDGHRQIHSFGPTGEKDNYLFNNQTTVNKVTRFVKYTHKLLENGVYRICFNDNEQMLRIHTSPGDIETTDKNTDIFRTVNIRSVSNRPLVLPPMAVFLVLCYTRRLLLRDC